MGVFFFSEKKKKRYTTNIFFKNFPLNKEKGDVHTQMETFRKGAWEMAYLLPLGKRPGGLGKGILPSIFSCLVLLELILTKEHVFLKFNSLLSALSLCCCKQAFSSCSKWGYSSKLSCLGSFSWWLLIAEHATGEGACGPVVQVHTP